jgi:hypothetical protein
MLRRRSSFVGIPKMYVPRRHRANGRRAAVSVPNY